MIIFLIVISFILIIFNIRALRKDNQIKDCMTNLSKQEQNLNNDKKSFSDILNDKEKSIDKNDIEMIKLRKDLSETIVEIQRDMLDLKEEIEYLKSQNKILSNKKENNEKTAIITNKIFEEIKKDADNKEENNKNFKINEVKQMIELKKSDEEICSKLQIGRGELLLIKDLYK